MTSGYYYLHTNGDLIYKRNLDTGQVADFRESNFVKMFWSFDPEDRSTVWRVLVESLACGANIERVMELADKWECDDEDAKMYVNYLDDTVKLEMDGGSWCATREDFIDLQESPAGFGDTCLEALGELCKDLGYIPQKMWGNSFENLCEVKKEVKV